MSEAAAISSIVQPAQIPAPGMTNEPAGIPRGGRWYTADMYGVAFGRGRVARMQRLRWIAGLPSEQKAFVDGEWRISGEATLPTRETVAAFAQQHTLFRPPEGWPGYNERQRRTWRLQVERELLFRRLLDQHRDLSRSSPEAYQEFGRVYAEWLTSRGLTATRAVMYSALAALLERSEIPRRGRPPGAGKAEWHPRAEYLSTQFLYHSHASAAEIWRTLRACARDEGFPAPARKMVEERIRQAPEGAIVLARKGERALDQIAPKGRRPRQTVRGWYSLDCRTEDVFGQVPTAGGGVKHARLICSGILAPYSWRWLDLRFGRTENAELIGASVRAAALRHGLGRVYQTDNGTAYDFLSNASSQFLSVFGATVIRAPAYEGYNKPIESAWNSVKSGLDVWWRSFSGGCPARRPEDVERWAQTNVYKLPTIDDFNKWAAVLMDTHNATARAALGGLTPNLHAELHDPDRLVVDADTIAIFLCPIVAKRKCSQNGVEFHNLTFRPEPEDLARLQGRSVWLRRDPELADRIVLCRENGEPICHAYTRLPGATREHAREARRQRERYKRAIRAYIPARDDSLATETGRILRVKRDYALAEEQRLRAALGVSDQRGVRIIQPSLSESVKKLKSRERPRGGKGAAGRPAVAGGSTDRRTGFDRLAALADVAPVTDGPRIPAPDYARFADLITPVDDNEGPNGWNHFTEGVG